MTGTTCFTASNVVLNPQTFSNLSNNALYLGFIGPKPTHLPFSHSKLESRVKLTSFPMSKATHLRVSQDAFTPTEESPSSPPRVIGEHDLLIVGPGVLGRLVAQKWQEVLLHLFVS